jgi:hypothetical protein
MATWVNLGAGGVINLDQVVFAEVYVASTPVGDIRFVFPDGSYAVGNMGSSDAAALAAVVRLVDAVDPATYS